MLPIDCRFAEVFCFKHIIFVYNTGIEIIPYTIQMFHLFLLFVGGECHEVVCFSIHCCFDEFDLFRLVVSHYNAMRPLGQSDLYQNFKIVPPQLRPTPKPVTITFMPGVILPASRFCFKPIITVEETVLPISSRLT